MDYDTIEAHFEWFRAEAQSWSDLSEEGKAICEELSCISVIRDQPLFGPVYDAYDAIRAKFTQGTDGPTGVGFGVGAQLCGQVPALPKSTAQAYSEAEAETAADLDRVRKMVKEW